MSEPLQPAVRKIRRSAHAQLFGTGALNPRCSIIVAHPADEIVGAGCLISKLVDVSILHVTDGAPRCDSPLPEDFSDWSDYARARKSECLSALAIANVPGRSRSRLWRRPTTQLLSGWPSSPEQLPRLFQ